MYSLNITKSIEFCGILVALHERPHTSPMLDVQISECTRDRLHSNKLLFGLRRIGEHYIISLANHFYSSAVFEAGLLNSLLEFTVAYQVPNRRHGLITSITPIWPKQKAFLFDDSLDQDCIEQQIQAKPHLKCEFPTLAHDVIDQSTDLAQPIAFKAKGPVNLWIQNVSGGPLKPIEFVSTKRKFRAISSETGWFVEEDMIHGE